MLEHRKGRACVSRPLSTLASFLPGPGPDAHSWACQQDIAALSSTALNGRPGGAPSSRLFDAMWMPSGLWPAFRGLPEPPLYFLGCGGKVLLALSDRVLGRAPRIEAADLFGVPCGGREEAVEGFGSHWKYASYRWLVMV